MEDEEDNAFSNKYLNDLREGRCPHNQNADVAAGEEASVSVGNLENIANLLFCRQSLQRQSSEWVGAAQHNGPPPFEKLVSSRAAKCQVFGG